MDECRQQFESLMSEPPYEQDLRRNGESSAWPGNYRNYPVQLAWCAWEELWNRRAEPVPEIDCRKCANRGKINGLSQETYCEQCNHQGYRQDHFIAAPEVKK